MSKSRAFFSALAAPAIYLGYNIVATMIAALVLIPYGSLMDAVNDPEKTMKLVQDLTTELLSHTVEILIVTAVLFMGTMMLVYRKRTPTIWQSLKLVQGVRPTYLVYAAVIGFGTNLATLGLVSGIQIPEEWEQSYSQMTEALLGGNIIFSILAICLVAPFVEEVVFRGFSQRILMTAYTPAASICLQAVLFSLFHGNPLQSTYTLLAGVLAGFVYLWTNSLWGAVMFHIVYNSTSFIGDAVLVSIFENNEIPSSVWAVFVAFGFTMALFGMRQLSKIRHIETAV